MKSLVAEIDGLDKLIRELNKIDSKMKAGQFIDAWRENRRVISLLENNKTLLLQEADKSELTNEE